MSQDTIITLAIFLITLTFLALELFDKAITTPVASLVLILFGMITLEDAIAAIDFETLFVLAGMMMLIEIAKKSGFFSWLTVRITSLSRGNPFYIFLLFSLLTGIFAMFFSNVTTILIMAPITIELMKGMGRDPKPYLLAEIFLSNMGGAGTLIGDPANIIIGSAAKLSFNDFLINLFPVVTLAIVLTIAIFYLIKWQDVKPITNDLEKIFLSNILIRKIRYKYLSENIDKTFIIKSVAVLIATIVGFMLQSKFHLPLPVVALTAAFILMIICGKKVHAEKILESVQWSTLFFFAGLFIVVSAVEKTGVLELVGETIANSTDNFTLLLILIVWAAGLISMIVDNAAFVTIMIPILFNIQTHFAGNPHLDLLWWALALGAVFGGNGTIIGTSANVVGTEIARKNGVKITFGSFFVYGFPFAAMSLSLASMYLLIRFYYF